MAAVAAQNVGPQNLGNRGSYQVNEYKSLFVTTDDTADAGDTIAVTLAEHGINTVQGVKGYVHTTSNSVMTEEAVTTAVAAGVLTLTIPAGSDNDIRVIQIFYT